MTSRESQRDIKTELLQTVTPSINTDLTAASDVTQQPAQQVVPTIKFVTVSSLDDKVEDSPQAVTSSEQQVSVAVESDSAFNLATEHCDRATPSPPNLHRTRSPTPQHTCDSHNNCAASLSDVVRQKLLHLDRKSPSLDLSDIENDALSVERSGSADMTQSAKQIASQLGANMDPTLETANMNGDKENCPDAAVLDRPPTPNKAALPLSLPRFSILDDDIDITLTPHTNGDVSKGHEGHWTTSKREGPVTRRRENKAVRPLGVLDGILTDRERSRSTENLAHFSDSPSVTSHQRKRTGHRKRLSSWHKPAHKHLSLAPADHTSAEMSAFQSRLGLASSPFTNGDLKSFKSLGNLSNLHDNPLSLTPMMHQPPEVVGYIDRVQQLKDNYNTLKSSHLHELDCMSQSQDTSGLPTSPVSYDETASVTSSEAEGYLERLRRIKEQHNSDAILLGARQPTEPSYIDKLQQLKQRHEDEKSQQMRNLLHAPVANSDALVDTTLTSATPGDDVRSDVRNARDVPLLKFESSSSKDSSNDATVTSSQEQDAPPAASASCDDVTNDDVTSDSKAGASAGATKHSLQIGDKNTQVMQSFEMEEVSVTSCSQ